jgi:hypothetical protein
MAVGTLIALAPSLRRPLWRQKSLPKDEKRRQSKEEAPEPVPV